MLFKMHSTWIGIFIALIPNFAIAETLPIPNSNPNPLLFPTRPEEVKIQENVPITLIQALELAQRNNQELQVVKLELERSRSALKEAQSALFPSLGVNGSVTNNGDGFLNNSSSPSTSFNSQAQLSYNLYTSGNREASIRAAEEQLRIDELDVENRLLEIRLNVSTEYYDLQQADEQVRINQSSVENSQASLRDAQARQQAGVGTRFDVLQTQVNLANSLQNLTNSISQQQIARRRLATRLSLPQSINISAADPVELAGLWQQPLEETIIQAFQNRPELQQVLAQRNISEQQRRQALSQLGPQISLNASYSLLDRYNDSVSVSDGYSLGLQASLNLFDGGAARARAAQSKANIAIAETQFSSQRNQIRFDVEQYYLQLQSNLDNVQTSSVAINQAKEALSIARLRFQAGVGTQTEVISAENDLTIAEGNRVTAILNYNRALANLQRSSNQK
ncbi:TolC family protein [Anabaena lutea]|uniref:TolC family protein n=1 Tax=Anabaena lutea FACHB-196 TaxID=2692881 RepID=A0ABR8FKC1_9NOST|nr:TolC family protein [Anabaena lutea]MBD2570315.1 TolC family protein [Anabaena lutea FACHB-196]